MAEVVPGQRQVAAQLGLALADQCLAKGDGLAVGGGRLVLQALLPAGDAEAEPDTDEEGAEVGPTFLDECFAERFGPPELGGRLPQFNPFPEGNGQSELCRGQV